MDPLLVDIATFETEVVGKGKAMRNQVPLKLAYAITVHKSQGMSIWSLDVDLSEFFVGGQVYTALSRARTTKGLTILGNFDPKRVVCDVMVKKFYNFPDKPEDDDIIHNDVSTSDWMTDLFVAEEKNAEIN